MIKATTHILLLIVSFVSFSQRVVIDPGHGWGAGSPGNCANPDGRLEIEMETAFVTSQKLKTLIDQTCSNIDLFLTRSDNDCGSWISLSSRTTMANSWGADAFLSIHTNGGGGTGTETFWCTNSPSSNTADANFCNIVQDDMVSYGSWTDRRAVEDATFLSFHLFVLRNSNMSSVLSEIGFGDNSNDFVKLASDSWRDQFAQSYLESLKTYLNITCAGGAIDTSSGSCNNPIPIACGDQLNGQTYDGGENFNSYGCVGLNEYGPEKIHRFVLADSANVAFRLSNITANLDVFLLTDSCDPNSCIDFGYFSLERDSIPPGTYYISVDGQGDQSTAQSDSYTLSVECYPLDQPIVSISEINFSSQLDIYPNPTNSLIHIKSKNNSTISYRLYSSLGKELKSGNFKTQETFSIAEFPKGNYFIYLSNNQSTAVKSIIKQ